MCLLPGKHSAVCLLNLSVCQMRFWPFGRSSSASLRPLIATAYTSGRHVSHIASPLPAPNFFFLASANYKHMRPCGYTACCQISRLLLPLSSALWHAGRFILPPKWSLSAVLSFYWKVPGKQLSLENMTLRLMQKGEMWGGCVFFETFLSILMFPRDCSHRKESFSFSFMLNLSSIEIDLKETKWTL